MDSLKVNPAVDTSKLYHVKGKCKFCSMTNHTAKDCKVNVQKKFESEPARAKASQMARDLAGKIFK